MSKRKRVEAEGLYSAYSLAFPGRATGVACMQCDEQNQLWLADGGPTLTRIALDLPKRSLTAVAITLHFEALDLFQMLAPLLQITLLAFGVCSLLWVLDCRLAAAADVVLD